MTLEDFIQEEGRKYGDGRENKPDFREMMEILWRMRCRAPKKKVELQTDFVYEVTK